MAKKRDAYVYGKSPSPRDWHELAQTLKDIQGAKRKKPQGPSFSDRLDSIEKLLKEPQNA